MVLQALARCLNRKHQHRLRRELAGRTLTRSQQRLRGLCFPTPETTPTPRWPMRSLRILARRDRRKSAGEARIMPHAPFHGTRIRVVEAPTCAARDTVFP